MDTDKHWLLWKARQRELYAVTNFYELWDIDYIDSNTVSSHLISCLSMCLPTDLSLPAYSFNHLEDVGDYFVRVFLTAILSLFVSHWKIDPKRWNAIITCISDSPDHLSLNNYDVLWGLVTNLIMLSQLTCHLCILLFFVVFLQRQN